MSLQILIHIGFLTEESGDVFSPRVLKGGPLGEMVQWADILAALFMLGHSLRVTVSLKELQRWVLVASRSWVEAPGLKRLGEALCPAVSQTMLVLCCATSSERSHPSTSQQSGKDWCKVMLCMELMWTYLERGSALWLQCWL